MPKKDKLVLSLIFFGLLSLIFFDLEKNLSFPDQNWSLEKGEKAKISSEIVQKFQADRDGLTRIKILFGSSDVAPGGKFDFKIYQENCQDIVRKTTLEITSLDSENTTDFIFSKIKNSKNKIFCFKLSYTQKKGGKKTNVFINENSMEQNKFLSVNGEEKKDQSLAMRPAYRNENIFQDFIELNQRISQYKPFFLKHYFLWFIIIGFIILSLTLIVMLIIL